MVRERPLAERKRVSRRDFLFLSAAAGTLAGADLMGSSSAAATARVAPQTVNYQPSPHGASRCGTCSYFQAPSSCQFVNGSITPNGWCVLYSAKE